MAEGVFVTTIVARIRALLPRDWRGTAGGRFKDTARAISEYAEEHHVRPQDLLNEGLNLGRRKLTGLATQEHSAAEKNYAEAAKAFCEIEDRKIETELKRRSLESRAKKEEADARKSLADARLTEIQAYTAELDLLKKLEEIGVVLRCDQNGDLTALPLPVGLSVLAVRTPPTLSVGSVVPPGTARS